MRPLEGLRVVEAANYVSGPYAGMLLGLLGADVVKLEQPGSGDAFRNWKDGASSPTFEALNVGKRSVAVDLKHPEGQRLVRELLRGADVFIENFRPGVLERYGLGPTRVQQRAPRLVYCSITGFGPDGPLADRPGYDTVGQARGGLLSLLTDLTAPQPIGFSMSDHLSGLFAVLGVLAALQERERTGRGNHVRTSLLEATSGFLAESLGRFLMDGRVPNRRARARLAQVYAVVAGDGKPLVVHLSSPEKFWRGLCQAIGQPALADDVRFRDRHARMAHYDELRELLADISGTFTRAELLRRLDEAGVPCAPVQAFDELLADPQVQHLGLLSTTSGNRGVAVRHLRSAVLADGWLDAEPMGDPPSLGEDTWDVLGSAGVGAEELAELDRAGVIARGVVARG